MNRQRYAKAFRNAGAAGYHERCNCLFSGMSRFFAVSYKAHLVQEWLPSLDGVTEKLARGATVPALISVRAIPLGKSGVAGLCWLIRPL